MEWPDCIPINSEIMQIRSFSRHYFETVGKNEKNCTREYAKIEENQLDETVYRHLKKKKTYLIEKVTKKNKMRYQHVLSDGMTW